MQSLAGLEQEVALDFSQLYKIEWHHLTTIWPHQFIEAIGKDPATTLLNAAQDIYGSWKHDIPHAIKRSPAPVVDGCLRHESVCSNASQTHIFFSIFRNTPQQHTVVISGTAVKISKLHSQSHHPSHPQRD